MKRIKKFCLSVLSAAFFLGACTCSLNVNAATAGQTTQQVKVSASSEQATAAASVQSTSTEQVSLATPRISVIADYQSATVTWKAVKGASKYKVSCSDGQSVTFKKAGTYTFTKLKEGRTYTFTVTASSSNAKSSSKKLSATIPVTISQNVTGLSVYASNDCLNLKWNTIYTANGYSIYLKKEVPTLF